MRLEDLTLEEFSWCKFAPLIKIPQKSMKLLFWYISGAGGVILDGICHFRPAKAIYQFVQLNRESIGEGNYGEERKERRDPPFPWLRPKALYASIKDGVSLLFVVDLILTNVAILDANTHRGGPLWSKTHPPTSRRPSVHFYGDPGVPLPRVHPCTRRSPSTMAEKYLLNIYRDPVHDLHFPQG